MPSLTDGSKRAFLSIPEDVEDYKNSSLSRGIHLPNFAVLKEKVISDYVGISFPTNHFMYDVYNEKIAQLVESGIVQNFLDSSKPKKPIENDKRVPLSVDHLLIWFQLWMGLLVASIVVFLLEASMWRIRKIVMEEAVKTLKIYCEGLENIE
jgi:hypothetical protein